MVVPQAISAGTVSPRYQNLYEYILLHDININEIVNLKTKSIKIYLTVANLQAIDYLISDQIIRLAVLEQFDNL